MEEIKNKLIREIKEFTKYALLTNDLFRKKFDIDISPIKALKSKRLIPAKGSLDYCGNEVTYEFHGLGCRFVFDENTIIDFNYKAHNWDFEGFSLFYFWEFVKPRIPEFDNKQFLEDALSELEKEGVIKKVRPSYSVYKLVEHQYCSSPHCP